MYFTLIYFHEVKNLWSYTSTPHMPSGQAQEQLYLYNAAC